MVDNGPRLGVRHARPYLQRMLEMLLGLGVGVRRGCLPGGFEHDWKEALARLCAAYRRVRELPGGRGAGAVVHHGAHAVLRRTRRAGLARAPGSMSL